jgi:proteic killer suppression protein
VLFGVAIRSFADAEVERFFREGRLPRGAGWAQVTRIVARKLDMLEYAGRLSDLASPPGNRLEALRGDLRGRHSIRINDQWRIVFRWTAAGPTEVDVCDYH